MFRLLRIHAEEIFLIFIWGIAIIIVNPFGEFPINDDWAYSRIVYHLTYEGKFHMGEWPAMTLISQSLLGAAFCKIVGFSFDSLRILTIFVSIASTCFFYFFIKDFTNNKKLSFFFALVWLFNPIYFSLSFTFMTEIYFLFFLLLSLFFYFKYLNEDNKTYLVVGTFFALAATFTRQLGIILPFAFGIVLIVKLKKNIKNLIFSFIPFTIILLSLCGYIFWLKATNNFSPAFGKLGDLIEFFQTKDTSYFYFRLGLVLFYIGFLFLPAVFFALPNYKAQHLKKRIIFIILISSVLIPAMYSAWYFFPFGNTLVNGGLGPKLLNDSCYEQNIFPILSEKILNGARFLCVVSIIILIAFLTGGAYDVLNHLRDKPSSVRLIKLCSAITFISFLGFVIFNPNYFDRYCLPLILFLFIVVVPVNENVSFKKSWIGIVFLTVFGLFSILLTHDFFSWNRARWKAINYLMMEKKIKPTQIDGGFEFNEWYETWRRNPDETTGKNQNNFVISSCETSGFQKIKSFPYQHYAPPGEDFIYILVHKTN